MLLLISFPNFFSGIFQLVWSRDQVFVCVMSSLWGYPGEKPRDQIFQIHSLSFHVLLVPPNGQAQPEDEDKEPDGVVFPGQLLGALVEKDEKCILSKTSAPVLTH